MEQAELAVLAWGAHQKPRQVLSDPREALYQVMHSLKLRAVVLGLTKEGHPRHPLYVAGDTEPQPYVVVPR